KENKLMFWLMFFGCLIGFGLSVLWLKLSMPIFALIILASLAQTYGAFMLYRIVRRSWTYLILKWSAVQRFVLIFVGSAFAAKILLQLASNVPAVSQFAFGFRNVVIAYLHLVLLMCIATYLLSLVLATNYFNISKNRSEERRVGKGRGTRQGRRQERNKLLRG